MKAHPSRLVAAVAVAVLAGAGPTEAQEEQPITLQEAVAEALSGNASLAEAELEVRAARAGARGASAFLWPSLAAEAGVVRSDDPVAAFGTKLRQGRFTEADFEVGALNHPDAATDWTVGVGATWPVLDPARWSAREAALRQADAAALRGARTREAVIFRTKVLYFEAVRAEGRLQAARRALEAADAAAERVRRRRDQGLLTDAHVLEARAEREGARAGLSDARRVRSRARSDLALHLGWPEGRIPVAADTAMTSEPTEHGGSSGVEARADLRALEARLAAARAEEGRALRSRLPALEGFARLSTHAPEPAGTREESWTVGLRLRVPVFTGLAVSADRDAARALRGVAASRLEQARREARAELRNAADAVESARQILEANRAAADAAREGRRLLTRRFEEGMATTAELLQAEARVARMESGAVDALAAYRMALARLEFAGGGAGRHITSDLSRDHE